MENVRVIGRYQFERSRCLTFGDGFESALQLQAVGSGIGSNRLAIACERLERFGMRLRQREQAVRLVAERFQRAERLREFFGQPFGRIEVGSQHEATRIVAVQLIPRCLVARDRMRKAGRAAPWARAAQHGALERCDRAPMRAGFDAEPK